MPSSSGLGPAASSPWPTSPEPGLNSQRPSPVLGTAIATDELSAAGSRWNSCSPGPGAGADCPKRGYIELVVGETHATLKALILAAPQYKNQQPRADSCRIWPTL